MTLQPLLLNFLIYEENFIFFYISALLTPPRPPTTTIYTVVTFPHILNKGLGALSYCTVYMRRSFLEY
jgi:hypothetical protein